MTDMRRKSIGYVDNVRPRRAKKEFDPYIRKRGKRKKAPGRAA